MTDAQILPASRLKWFLILLPGLALLVGGFMMIRNDLQFSWPVFLLGALLTLSSVASLLPGSCYLKLDRRGFTFYKFYHGQQILWSDVKEFGLFSPPRSPVQMVGFNFKENARPNSAWRSLAQSICPYEASLPDTYGKSAGELARLLEAWRKRCAG